MVVDTVYLSITPYILLTLLACLHTLTPYTLSLHV